MSLVLPGVRRGQILQDGHLGVELVWPSAAAAAGLSTPHPQTGQFVAFETGLPVVRSLHQLFGHELAGEDQIF